MTGVYLIPLTENSIENFDKTIRHADESLMNLLNETESWEIQTLLDMNRETENRAQNLGLWAYINNRGSNNKSYWNQMKENDLILFFDFNEKLTVVGRIYRKPEAIVSSDIAEKLFGEKEFNLFFSIKDLVSFEKSNIKFSDIGAIAGYDFNFPRGNLRIIDKRVKKYDIINRIYELILLETKNEKMLGVHL